MINLLISIILLFASPLVAMDELLSTTEDARPANVTVARFELGHQGLRTRPAYERRSERPDFSGPLLDGSLISLTVNTDMEPAFNIAQNLALAAWKNRPAVKIINPMTLFRNVIPGFSKLVVLGGPLWDNADIIQEMWYLIQDDRINGFRHAVQVFQHCLLSGMIVNPEWVEYFHMCLDEFAKVVDPEIMDALHNAGVLDLLNSLRYQNEAPALVENTNLPQKVNFGIKTALVSYNMLLANAKKVNRSGKLGQDDSDGSDSEESRHPRLRQAESKGFPAQLKKLVGDLPQVPLKPEDRHRSLQVVSSRPAKRLGFVPLQLVFFQACYKGNQDGVADFLMKYPSLINRQDAEGMTPLLAAALGAIHSNDKAVKNACTAIFNYLLMRGANPDAILLKVNGTVRQYLQMGLDEWDEKYDELLKLIKARDAFFADLIKHLAPVEAGKARPAAPTFAEPAKVVEIDACLARADLNGVMRCISDNPRLKYMVDANGMSLLHKTATLLLTQFIELLRRDREEMNRKYQGKSDEELKYLFVEEKGAGSKDQEKKLVKPLYLQPEPLFWSYAKRTQVHKLGKIWSYLLNAGVPLEIKDLEGNTVAGYFILIEDMYKEFFNVREEARLLKDVMRHRGQSSLWPVTDAELQEVKSTLVDGEKRIMAKNRSQFEIADRLKEMWIGQVRAPFVSLQLTVRGQGLVDQKAAADRRAIARGIKEEEEAQAQALEDASAPKQIELKPRAAATPAAAQPPAAASQAAAPKQADSDSDSDSEEEDSKKADCIVS